MKSTTAFVVSFTLLISTFAALAQEKDAEYTIVVPLGLMQFEGVGGWTDNRIYGVEVHEESDWGINFAHVETTSFEKIGNLFLARKTGKVQIEHSIDLIVMRISARYSFNSCDFGLRHLFRLGCKRDIVVETVT